MYRALVLASRFADWLTLAASVLASFSAEKAQASDEKALEVRINAARTKIEKARSAARRASALLDQTEALQYDEIDAARTAHPMVA